MIALNDIAEANRLLVSLGGEDQMGRIAAASIERYVDLQHRVDRALAYAKAAPANSTHAKQIARILDGSITLDDEAQEIGEQHPLPHQQPKRLPVEAPRRRGPGRPKAAKGAGLAGRSTRYRKEFRAWVAEQGIDLPYNKLAPQLLVDAFDNVQAGRHDAGRAGVQAWLQDEGRQYQPSEEGRLFGQ